MIQFESFEEFAEFFVRNFTLFLQEFAAMDFANQLLTSLLLIMGLVGIGYLVYGILWISYQSAKFSIVLVIVLHYLMYLAVKLLFVALISPEKLDQEKQFSGENLKWLISKAYPEAYKKELKEIKQKYEFKNEEMANPANINKSQTKIMVVKNGLSSYFCPTCGKRFSDRMERALGQKMFCYCEHCGQEFVYPDNNSQKLYQTSNA